MPARVVKNNSAALLAKIGQKVGGVLTKGAFDVQAIAQASIKNGPKTGRRYRRRAKRGSRAANGRFLKTGSTIYHQASAPGEAPATDYGNLWNGIIVQSVLGTKLRRRVISTAAYSRLLEMEMDRPFLVPALEKVRPVVIRAMKGLLNRV